MKSIAKVTLTVVFWLFLIWPFRPIEHAWITTSQDAGGDIPRPPH